VLGAAEILVAGGTYLPTEMLWVVFRVEEIAAFILQDYGEHLQEVVRFVTHNNLRRRIKQRVKYVGQLLLEQELSSLELELELECELGLRFFIFFRCTTLAGGLRCGSRWGSSD